MRLVDMDTLWQCETCFHHKSYGCDTWCDTGEAYRPSASKLKVIDPESLRQKGEWIHDINNLYGCSNCGGRETMSPKKLKPFCPNCGADMRKDD